jgi:hypothetical protein
MPVGPRSPCWSSLLINVVKWLPYSDQIIVLSSEGRLSQLGTFQSLVSIPGYLHDLNLKDAGIENLSSVREKDVSQSKADPPTPEEKSAETELVENRGCRDSSNLLYYINTMGRPYFGLFLLLVTMEVVFTALQRK